LIELRELGIHSIEFGDIKILSSLLGHLRALSIISINTKALIHLSKECTNLEILTIENYHNYIGPVIPLFPKLIHFEYIGGERLLT